MQLQINTTSPARVLITAWIFVIQWGVLRNLRKKVKANPLIIMVAIFLDIVVLSAFLWTKAGSDLLIVIVSIFMIGLIFTGEKLFLSRQV